MIDLVRFHRSNALCRARRGGRPLFNGVCRAFGKYAARHVCRATHGDDWRGMAKACDLIGGALVFDPRSLQMP